MAHHRFDGIVWRMAASQALPAREWEARVRAATFRQPRRKPVRITAAIRFAPELPITKARAYQRGSPSATGFDRACSTDGHAWDAGLARPVGAIRAHAAPLNHGR
jgi:hypothetical protein